MKATEIPNRYLELMDTKDRASLGNNGKLMSERKAELDATMEKSMHNLFAQYLQLHEIFYIHSNMARKTRSTPGVPDFCFAINGQAIGVEFKTIRGELSKDQENAIARMRKDLWAIEVCTSLAQALNFVNKFKQQNQRR